MPSGNTTTTGETTAATLSGGEWVRGVQAGGNVKMTTQAIANLFSPTSAKGDLIVRSASGDGRLAVGANGYTPVADDTQAVGIRWDGPMAKASDLSNAANGFGADLIGGGGRVVGSISALRALSKTGIGQARVTGYYAPGDGGGGRYYCDSADTTSTDNGGTIIVASDGGRWKLTTNGSVTNLQFGAYPTTAQGDSTAALQNAINWCGPRDLTLLQIGVSASGNLTMPGVGAYGIRIIGVGTAEAGACGWTYTGTTTMITGAGADVELFFNRYENMVFTGNGGSTICIYGQMYQGGVRHCQFKGWSTGLKTFGDLCKIEENSFLGNGTGLWVTNWPAGSSQAGVGTTTIITRGNDFNGNTSYGARWDTSTTGGANFVSCGSHFDTYEGNGVHLYINKTFAFALVNPHFELATTWAIQALNSNVTIICPYYGGGDGSKISITFPGASANTGGYCQLGTQGTNVAGVLGNSLTLSTQAGHDATFTALDNGHVVAVAVALDIGASPIVSGVNQLAGATVSLAAAAGAPGLATFANTTAATSAVLYQNTNGTVGSISTSASSTAYNTSSDVRLKKNIQTVALGAFGEVIDQISIVSYDWKADNTHARMGVIAQDLQSVLPEAVTPGDSDSTTISQTWGIDLSPAIPMLINEVQSLRARLKAAGIA